MKQEKAWLIKAYVGFLSPILRSLRALTGMRINKEICQRVAHIRAKVREEMSETSVILEIDEQDFTIRLYESMLKIDLKGRTKNRIVEVLEN